MRFSGPKMLFGHPILAIRHLMNKFFLQQKTAPMKTNTPNY